MTASSTDRPMKFMSLSLILVDRIRLLRFGLSFCFQPSSFARKHVYWEVMFSNSRSTFVTVPSIVALSFSFSFDDVYFFVL